MDYELNYILETAKSEILSDFNWIVKKQLKIYDSWSVI
jgi:hypothetical protein